MRHRIRSVALALVLLVGLMSVAPVAAQGGSASLSPRGPANDDFASAQPVGADPSWSQDTTGATTEAGEWLGPCDGWTFKRTVWYSLTLTESATVTVDTFGSDFDTFVTVYTGSWGHLTNWGCNDDEPGHGLDSQLSFTATAGTTYWIQVGAYNQPGLLVLNLTGTESGAECGGLPATIVGTAAADTLNGSSGVDVILALGGNDTIHGNGGSDVVCAGPGADRVYGDAGADRLYGQGGRDSLFGGEGNDRLFGQGGNDAINGEAGNDRLVGGPGTDTLVGGPGTNTCLTGETVTC